MDDPQAGDERFSVVWDRPGRAGRGRPPGHDRAEITAAAIALADAEGIDAVSTRRVAAALGTGTASLYRYLDRKEDLFDLMTDAVDGEDGPPPPPTGDWRADLRAIAHRTRQAMHRHPWMAALAIGRPSMGPNSLAVTEQALAAVEPLGLDPDGALTAVETVASFVRGYVIRELAEREAIRRSGISARQWMDAYGPYVQRVIREGRHPRVARIILDAGLPHAADRATRGFSAGLDHILNGIGSRP